MTDNRSKILVETFYSRETNRLELTKKMLNLKIIPFLFKYYVSLVDTIV